MKADNAMMPSLVSTQWLAEQLGAQDLRVMDATVYMPSEERNASSEFSAGHIPGAAFFDIDEIADKETSLLHMVPAVGRFERMVGALGISNVTRVVFYDQKGLFSAPRAWWMMRLFGHAAVAVLDGGLPKWRARYRANLCARKLRGLGDVLENVATRRELLLDARAADRFLGQVPEPRAGLRRGHVPGAVNVPFQELLAPDQTLRSVEQLRVRFAQAGVDTTRAVTTMCGSGLTAAVLTLGLSVAGLAEGALYDGSWTEWGARADTPVVLEDG